MNFTHTFLYLTIYSLYFLLPSNVPGQGLLDSIAAFITGPFGKAITLIAIVLCRVSYMYGKQSDNSHIGRVAIGAALIVGAANIFAYIQQADRKSTRLNSSHTVISYAVFCLKKKKKKNKKINLHKKINVK